MGGQKKGLQHHRTSVHSDDYPRVQVPAALGMNEPAQTFSSRILTRSVQTLLPVLPPEIVRTLHVLVPILQASLGGLAEERNQRRS